MRLFHFLLAGLFAWQPSYADVVQVPLHSDGTTNLDEVYSGFELAVPTYSNGARAKEFRGILLRQPFYGEIKETENTQDFSLSIEAPTLSEHGNFLIAVLVTDAVCVQDELRPGLVLWKDTAYHNGSTWDVSTSCTNASE